MKSRLIDVAGRHQVRVYEGGSGPQLLFMHGAGGLLANDPFLARLEQKYSVTAPLLPGYEDSDSSEPLRTMLDFTLFGLDVWETLKLKDPILVGHSMGGMIAAEMAAMSNTTVDATRADLSGGLVARRRSDPRPVLEAAVRAARPAVPRAGEVHRRCCRPAATSTTRSS